MLAFLAFAWFAVQVVVLGRFVAVPNAIGIGAAVSIVDVLSFTRAGRWTANARAMARRDVLTKLIVYGRGRRGEPVPTKGFGDFALYALLLAVLQTARVDAARTAVGALAIVLGCAVTWAVAAARYRRTDYRGLPATIVPFLLFLPVLLG